MLLKGNHHFGNLIILSQEPEPNTRESKSTMEDANTKQPNHNNNNSFHKVR